MEMSFDDLNERSGMKELHSEGCEGFHYILCRQYAVCQHCPSLLYPTYSTKSLPLRSCCRSSAHEGHLWPLTRALDTTYCSRLGPGLFLVKEVGSWGVLGGIGTASSIISASVTEAGPLSDDRLGAGRFKLVDA